jgi:hypothetical protein
MSGIAMLHQLQGSDDPFHQFDDHNDARGDERDRSQDGSEERLGHLGMQDPSTWCQSASYTTKEATEKLDTRRPGPKGAIDFERLAVSLKRYPDTKHEFFRSL